MDGVSDSGYLQLLTTILTCTRASPFWTALHPSDKASLASTCRQLREVVFRLSESLWVTIQSPDSRAHAKRTAGKLPQLRSLNIRSWEEAPSAWQSTPACLEKFITTLALPNVIDVALLARASEEDHCVAYTAPLASALGRALPHLTSLTIEQGAIRPHFLTALTSALPKLQTLHLDQPQCYIESDEEHAELVQAPGWDARLLMCPPPGVTELRLVGGAQLGLAMADGARGVRWRLHPLVRLQKLHLEYTCWSMESAPAGAGAGAGGHQQQQQHQPDQQHHHAMQHPQGQQQHQQGQQQQQPHNISKSPLPTQALVELHLIGIINMPSHAFDALWSDLTQLTCLELRSMFNYRHDVLFNSTPPDPGLLTQLQKLQQLTVCHCPWFNDQGVRALVGLPHLIHLKLGHLRGLNTLSLDDPRDPQGSEGVGEKGSQGNGGAVGGSCRGGGALPGVTSLALAGLPLPAVHCLLSMCPALVRLDLADLNVAVAAPAAASRATAKRKGHSGSSAAAAAAVAAATSTAAARSPVGRGGATATAAAATATATAAAAASGSGTSNSYGPAGVSVAAQALKSLQVAGPNSSSLVPTSLHVTPQPTSGTLPHTPKDVVTLGTTQVFWPHQAQQLLEVAQVMATVSHLVTPCLSLTLTLQALPPSRTSHSNPDLLTLLQALAPLQDTRVNDLTLVGYKSVTLDHLTLSTLVACLPQLTQLELRGFGVGGRGECLEELGGLTKLRGVSLHLAMHPKDLAAAVASLEAAVPGLQVESERVR